MKRIGLLLTLCILATGCARINHDSERPVAAAYYLAPDGDDRNEGTRARPFATLERARDAVRAVPADQPGDRLVLLKPGTYRLTRTFELGSRDSGRNGNRVVYRGLGEPGEAVLSGARPVTGWRYHGEGVWKAPVGDFGEFHTLYDNGRRAIKARHPNYEHNPDLPLADEPYLRSEQGSPQGEGGRPRTSWVTWKPGDLDPAMLETGTLKIVVFPWGKADWHRWNMTVTGIDPAARRITFDNQGDVTRIQGNARYFLEDQMAFLDQPGEFYLDRDAAMLYYIPMDGEPPAEGQVTAPILGTLVQVRGDAPGEPVTNITFDGLKLEETDARSPALHWWMNDWGRTDDALVHLRHAESVHLTRCHLTRSGRNGIMITGPNRLHRIEQCWIEHMGINAITVAYPHTDAEKMDIEDYPCEFNVITNTRFNDIGELGLYSHCIGMFRTSYNTVTHCTFRDFARYAITMRGNSVGQELGRAGNVGYEETRPPQTGNWCAYLDIQDGGQDSGDLGLLHLAGVNIEDGPYRNTFEQIHVRGGRAGDSMQDWAPDGIFLDWPNLTCEQVFRDILIEDVDGLPMRTNGALNRETAIMTNVSWEDGFDRSRLDFPLMGVRPDFPRAFMPDEPESETAPADDPEAETSDENEDAGNDETTD